jgi:hypothetical protein
MSASIEILSVAFATVQNGGYVTAPLYGAGAPWKFSILSSLSATHSCS